MCGISGIISDQNISNLLFDSLFQIQHRGQHSFGFSIETSDGIFTEKKLGLLNSLVNFDSSGNLGIGHVRYPTTKSKTDKDIQPFVINNICLAHNGNIKNYKDLYDEYQSKINLDSNSDSELLLNIINYELKDNFIEEKIISTIKKISSKIDGSYSIVMLIKGFGLVCFKDPFGIRPLVYGKSGNSYLISSESVSLNYLNYDIVKELSGGEIVFFKNNNNEIKVENFIYTKSIQKPCIFEWIYIAREDSIIHDVSVYQSRLKMGQLLGEKLLKENVDLSDIDYIIPIPDTSKPVALSLSEVLNIKYREAIIKNRYINRTFIMDDEKIRNKKIKKKLSVVKQFIFGKNIIIVDDSIVRGNTIKHIIDLLYENGVKSIIVLSSSPIIRYQNFYGLDIPTQEELIAYQKNISDIEKIFKIKKLIFLSIDEIVKSINYFNPKLTNFELSIFKGQ